MTAALELSFELLRVYKTTKAFWADGWQKRCEEWRPVLMTAAKMEQCSVLSAAIRLAKEAEGMMAITILSVAVEMTQEAGNV